MDTLTRHRLRLSSAVAFCVALLLGTSVLDAQEMPTPVSLQVSFALRVLEFDRARSDAERGEIVFAVVFQRQNRESRRAMEELEAAIETLEPGPGRVRMVAIDLEQTTDLQEALKSESFDMVYVAPLRAVAMGLITVATRAEDLLTITGVPEYVQEGLAVGIDEQGGKPRLLINLEAARDEGADLSSQLLKLARQVTERRDRDLDSGASPDLPVRRQR